MGHGGNRQYCGRRDLRTTVAQFVVLITDVGRQAQVAGAEVAVDERGPCGRRRQVRVQPAQRELEDRPRAAVAAFNALFDA